MSIKITGNTLIPDSSGNTSTNNTIIGLGSGTSISGCQNIAVGVNAMTNYRY